MKNLTICLLSISVAFSSCKTLQLGNPLTEKMVLNNAQSKYELTQVKVYLSNSVTLLRDIDADGGIQVTNGTVVKQKGRRIEALKISSEQEGHFSGDIRKGEPITVAFFENDENCVLYFEPDPANGGRYRLQHFEKSAKLPLKRGHSAPVAYPIPPKAYPFLHCGRQFYIETKNIPFLNVKNWK